ncbi:UBAP1-MVB12-associated (UMA)-domain containing protein 1 [Brienomyrus brachyistius]|uniref:UBAP1-MVB12-associated (UMA)-domain containing protein 1 n=1 Tax=Brienomyrus brachyistius TaxID=42636 RepID=UPI0020B26A85|nr:UBAP1-MVB12-associated (UMA)-domain containing protein 1 [Brienomyrus brachyistius]
MFHFFGRKDSSKKSVPEKELDGFVIVGETPEEQKQRSQRSGPTPPATGVIVLPSKTPYENLVQPATVQPVPAQAAPMCPAALAAPAASEGGPSLPELLSDVPFTLAPHVLAMQAGLHHFPDVLLSRDINDNLASFRYDFSLENSVLCDS